MSGNNALTPAEAIAVPDGSPAHQEMIRGYLDGFGGKPPPEITSQYYDWGRRNGFNDRNHTSDPEQAEAARPYLGRSR